MADPVVDLTGSATTSDYMTALSLLADDPNVGLLGVEGVHGRRQGPEVVSSATQIV